MPLSSARFGQESLVQSASLCVSLRSSRARARVSLARLPPSADQREREPACEPD